MMWVDFRSSDSDPLQQLIWGITGKRSFIVPLQPENQQKQQNTEKKSRTIISLRSEPMTVTEEEFRTIFELDGNGRPREYITNQFEDQGEVVVDHATGLMWQKSSSKSSMRFQNAPKYIKELNRKQFAGYNDWRLPTVPELMSLMEPEKQSNYLYINPIFDESWFWSADEIAGLLESAGAVLSFLIRRLSGANKIADSSGSAGVVNFFSGHVYWRDVDHLHYVRAVRSRQ